jgi:outer membrane biogenesis lipoprotein LolB
MHHDCNVINGIEVTCMNVGKLAVLLFVACALLAGCGANTTVPAASSQQKTAQEQQAVTRVQNEAKMPPEVKEKVIRQIQNEADRHQTTR